VLPLAERIQSDGAARVSEAVPTDAVQLLRDVEEQHSNAGTRLACVGGGSSSGTFAWITIPALVDLVTVLGLHRLASEALGTDGVRLFYDEFLDKPGTASNPTPWHRDRPYWPLGEGPAVSVWLALDPVSPSSGAIRYVTGSHLWAEELPPAHDASYQAALDAMTTAHSDEFRHNVRTWSLHEGDIALHSADVVHASGRNNVAGSRRRAYVTRWLGAGVESHPWRPGFMPLPEHLCHQGQLNVKALPTW
jgi:ectoine hydroxylase-related dioxygenase (phytanoyl-CoA dioxygenase family)